MRPTIRYIEVRSASGEVLFSINFIARALTPKEKPAPADAPQSAAERSGPEVKPTNGNVQTVSAQPAISSATALQPTPSTGRGPAPRQAPGTNGQGEVPPMTDAQKRLLFRLLANQGLEGDKAHEHLKELFQVKSLKEVTKLEASRGIEKLLDQAKGGQRTHATA